MKRMIHIAGSMSPSGIGNYIMNVYRHVDRTRVQFDFILCEKREISFDEEIESLGGRIYYVTRKAVSPLKNFMETRRIIKEGSYDTVFRHTDISTVALDLVAAALGGAKNRIPHSHSTATSNVKAHRLFMPLLNLISTQRFACSRAAGEWLYGTGRDFRVLINAIDLSEFDYDADLRKEVREELDLGEGDVLLGHIGNLLPVKNHLFLLEVLAKLPSNYKMIFVGDGECRGAIEDRISELCIKDRVIMTGVRKDTARILMGMDGFCFPSFYEGLPIALVEAQRSGLPCFISDRINRDCDVVDELLQRLPICDPRCEPVEGTDAQGRPGDDSGEESIYEHWAEAIESRLSSHIRADQPDKPFVDKGFDIDTMVKVYENLL